MTTIERFFDDAVADMRRQLAASGRTGNASRGAIEDRIALLTDYRLAGMDEAQFERLLAMLASGRSPVWLSAIDPARAARELAGDLAQRWGAYRAELIVPARN